MRMLLLGICTDTMCIVLSLMILDSPTDGKEGVLGTGESFRLCVLSSDFGRCFWVQTNFGTSDKLTVRERIVFYRLLPKMPCEKRYAVCSLFEAKVILMLCFPMLNDYRLHALHVFMFSKLHGAVAVCSLL